MDEFKRKPLTVLQLLPELYGGGVERGTLELSKYLVEKGHRSLVASGGGRLVKQLTTEGGEHITLPIGKKSPFTLRYIYTLRKILLSEAVDVLHLRSRVPAWVGYLAWKSIPESKRPLLVTTFHGFYSINRYSAIMAKGQVVIAVSQSIKDHIALYYHRTQDVIKIFRGVDHHTFSPELVQDERVEKLKKEWMIENGQRVLLFPGRLTRLKGQNTFLLSLARLKNDNFKAVLIGDIDESSAYTTEIRAIIAKHGLSDKVCLAGHCSDMPAAYKAADVIFSVSSTEPEAFGRIAVEAGVMEKAIIATRHGGSLETVIDGSTGWLVKPSDIDELKTVIERVLDMPKSDLESMGQRGKKRVLENFTTQTMCERTENVYYQYLQLKGY